MFDAHMSYFDRNSKLLPHHYTSNEASRMTLAFFCLSSIQMLGALDSVPRNDWIDWIYLQLVIDPAGYAGFRGGPYLSHSQNTLSFLYDQPHLAMTYTALLGLMILGDDLTRVPKSSIIQLLVRIVSSSFAASPSSHEQDMRFLFCASAISFILADWSAIDMHASISYIQQSCNYDGGFGVSPGNESHGGSTYCAIASLSLMRKLHIIQNNSRLIYWLVSRQNAGFHGRVNKPDDTCYGYWIGGSLSILGSYDLVDQDALEAFLKTTQSSFGGYGKCPGNHPDVMHSYTGIAALAISSKRDLPAFNSELGVASEVVKRAKELGFCRHPA